MTSSVRITAAAAAAVLALCLFAAPAAAQTIGTFRWQLRPYCNVVTVTVVQHGGVYHLDGTDDQCGASRRAGVRGLAFGNPDGSIGMALAIVTTPASVAVHVDATISMASLGGTWRDSAGATGSYVFTPGAPVAGSPRPVPSTSLAAGSVTAAALAAGAVTSASLAAGSVTAAALAPGAVGTASLAAGSVTAGALAAGAVTSGSLAAGSVTSAALAAGAVTGTAIANGSVTVAHLASPAQIVSVPVRLNAVLLPTGSTIRTLTMQAPAAGKLQVTVNGNLQTAGSGSAFAQCSISADQNLDQAHRYEFAPGTITATTPVFPFSTTRALDVPAAGPFTAYFVCFGERLVMYDIQTSGVYVGS